MDVSARSPQAGTNTSPFHRSQIFASRADEILLLRRGERPSAIADCVAREFAKETAGTPYPSASDGKRFLLLLQKKVIGSRTAMHTESDACSCEPAHQITAARAAQRFTEQQDGSLHPATSLVLACIAAIDAAEGTSCLGALRDDGTMPHDLLQLKTRSLAYASTCNVRAASGFYVA